LLASAAILGASGAGAFAQAPPNPTQGQYAAPLLGGPAANNNLNTFGTAVPGAALAPAPGTVVIRLNGKVDAQMDASWGNLLTTAPGSISNGAATNANYYKLNPITADSYFRLYPGIDGMASNGLRYGAAVEIRENFEGGNSFSVTATPTSATTAAVTLPSGNAITGTASSASGVSSAQTLFVRRAFVYLGSDQLGIIRLGQGDGLPGIYDATSIFTTGSWDGGIGNVNDSGVQGVTPNAYLLAWPFLSGNGTEYGNNKIVYLSPSFFGIDVGFEFAPSQGNGFTDSATSDPYAVGPCNTASANCVAVTSGTDESRWINRWGFGGRFIENVGGAVLQGYGEYIISGHAQNPSAKQAGIAVGDAGIGGATGALKYDGQNFFNGGLAGTFMGITVAADTTIGRENGSNAMVTSGGAPMHAEMASISYAIGPWSVGVVGAIIDEQGVVALTNVSQQHQTALAVGGAYRIAPGINLCLEYGYRQGHQGAADLATGAANGTNFQNDIHVQGLTFATIVNW
jgi:hypothetical protein